MVGLTSVVALTATASLTAQGQTPSQPEDPLRATRVVVGMESEPVTIPGIAGAPLSITPMAVVSLEEASGLADYYRQLLQYYPAIAENPALYQELRWPEDSNLPLLTHPAAFAEFGNAGDTATAAACWQGLTLAGTTYPYNSVSYFSSNYDGSSTWYEGSACVVAPYMALTCGHCVYSRALNRYRDNYTLIPNLQGTNGRPYGTWDLDRVRTNNTYKTTSDSNRFKYDYGAAFVESQFPFYDYPLVEFSYTPVFGNPLRFSGYPGSPPSGSKHYQWTGYQVVVWHDSRRMRLNIAGRGGQSGGPTWRVVNHPWGSTAIITGVYTYSHGCEAGITRLVSGNENLITSWMQWTPSGGPFVTAQVAGLPTNLSADRIIPLEFLGVVDAPVTAQLHMIPDRAYAQCIDNVIYHWREYDVPAADGSMLRAIRLIKPFNRFLTEREAQVLLSASLTRHSATAQPLPAGPGQFDFSKVNSVPFDLDDQLTHIPTPVSDPNAEDTELQPQR